MSLNRRQLLAGTGALLLAGNAGDAIAEIERRLGGRIGVGAARRSGGTVIAHRGGERFALCSTFKMGLAAFVLAEASAGRIALDEMIRFGDADLLDHAPVVRAARAAGALSVEALARAIVVVSDNSAANLLLARLGGPAALTRFYRRLGDRRSRLDRLEPALNSNLPDDPRDTTTPDAMIAQMRGLFGGGFDASARDRLIGWMADSRTGLTRLRGGLPPGWAAGDKTGTGERGAANDVAIAWPPDGDPVLIACYVDAPAATPAARDAAHRAVAAHIAVRLR